MSKAEADMSECEGRVRTLNVCVGYPQVTNVSGMVNKKYLCYLLNNFSKTPMFYVHGICTNNCLDLEGR